MASRTGDSYKYPTTSKTDMDRKEVTTANTTSAQATIDQLQQEWQETVLLKSHKSKSSKQPCLSDPVRESTETGPKTKTVTPVSFKAQQPQQPKSSQQQQQQSKEQSSAVSQPSSVLASLRLPRGNSTRPATTSSSSSTRTMSSSSRALSSSSMSTKHRRWTQKRYGRAVQELSRQMHQVALTDDMFHQLQDELRREQAVTNTRLQMTLPTKLITIYRHQITQQQALAQRLSDLNQSNQQQQKRASKQEGRESMTLLKASSTTRPLPVTVSPSSTASSSFQETDPGNAADTSSSQVMLVTV